jgi:hypothetical protein
VSDSLDKAAQAFDVELGNSSSRVVNDDGGKGLPIESMFDNKGQLEIDDGSPAQGGGDNLPVDDPRVAKPSKAKKEEPDEEIDEFERLRRIAEGEDGDESDDSADDEGGEEGDEDGENADEDEDDEQSDVYEVMIDGEKAEVSLDEALKGYIRTETFHRRLNDLDSYKQQLRTEAGKVLEDRQTYAKKIEELDEVISQLIPKEPDWDAEYAKNPVAARNLQKQYDQLKQLRQAAIEQKERAIKENTEADQKAFLEYRQEEAMKTMRLFPNWKDDKVMERDIRAMKETALSAKFTDEEFKQIYDHRMFEVLMKAAKYDRIMNRRPPKPVKKQSGKPVNSGAGRKSTAPKGGNRAAQQHLAKTGSVEAAAQVFAGLLNPQKRSK